MDPSRAELRAIVVEDEPLVLMLVEDMLVEQGIAIAGTAADVPDAIRLAQSADVDLAILDAHIIGGDVKPVFEVLRGRQIPVIFSTGSSSHAIRETYGDVPVLAKPFIADDIKSAIASALPA